MKRFLTLALLFLSISISYSQRQLIHCGRLIDVNSGNVLTEMTIVVEGDKILSVNEGYLRAPNGSGDVVIDLRNKTVMPGLMDMHVHLEGESSPPLKQQPNYSESTTWLVQLKQAN